LKYVPTLIFLLVLTSCVDRGEATATVSDAATAIKIAKELCDWRKMGSGWSWHAKLRQGIWHVWLNAEYKRDEEEAIGSVDIRASDGFSDGCPLVT